MAHKSFKVAIETSNNLIPTLHPYIQGHISLREASSSSVKVAPKKVAIPSRPTKKKVTKMSESKSLISTNDEETRPTLGAKLAYGVLSSEQNPIRREIMHKKLVRKGQVLFFNFGHTYWNMGLYALMQLPLMSPYSSHLEFCTNIQTYGAW